MLTHTPQTSQHDADAAQNAKPPVGLLAPKLCPRCDTPTTAGSDGEVPDQCAHCSLQLRACGNCRGVAGPFDRFCGFCGFELIRGERRSPLWRLWLAAALVPLCAGLGYGVWVARVPQALGIALHAVLHSAPAGPVATIEYASPGLGLHYEAPKAWTVVDYTAGQRQQPTVVLSQNPADQTVATDARGDLTMVEQAQSTVVTLSRPPIDATVVADTRDPVAALTSQVAPLVAAPPAGVKVEVAQPVRRITIGGRPAAEVVLRLTRAEAVWYLRRDLVYAPRAGATAVFRADTLAPAADWPAVDLGPVTTVVGSLSFS